MTVDGGSPGVDEVDATPIMVSGAALPEGIESVSIGDPKRARGWQIDGTLEFTPPEFDWFYVYITTQPTKFWSRRTLVLDAKDPAVTIFPPGKEHTAKLDGPAFVFGVSSPSAEVDPSAWPRTARVASLETAMKKLRGGPLRLIVGRKLKDEEDWEDRDWSLDEKGGVSTRQVLVNKRDLFELSVADENTKKSATAHRRTFEAYASGSDVQVFWRDKKEKFQLVKGPAIIVVSPPVCHAVSPSGTTYILHVSNDDWGIGDDTAPCKVSG